MGRRVIRRRKEEHASAVICRSDAAGGLIGHLHRAFQFQTSAALGNVLLQLLIAHITAYHRVVIVNLRRWCLIGNVVDVYRLAKD